MRYVSFVFNETDAWRLGELKIEDSGTQLRLDGKEVRVQEVCYYETDDVKKNVEPAADREQQLRDELNAIADELNQLWQRRSKPLVDELVEIENKKPPRPVIIMNLARFDNFGSFSNLLSEVVDNGGRQDRPCGDPNCPYCAGHQGKPN